MTSAIDIVYNKLINQGKFYHFCQNFKLNDNIKEENFEKMYNQPHLIHVFTTDGNKTTSFLSAIRERIYYHDFAVLVIYGDPNLAKSEMAQTIAKYFQDSYLEMEGYKPKINICFSDDEFKNLIKTLKKGDIVIRDESPKSAGQEKFIIQDAINNLTQIVRADQNFFIFVCPERVDASVVSFYLESAGKNFKTREMRFLLYDPRFQKAEIPCGRVILPLHEDEILRKNYKKRKDENIKRMKAMNMMATSTHDPERFEYAVKTLYYRCIELGVEKKVEIENEFNVYNMLALQEGKQTINGSTNFDKFIITYVYRCIKSGVKPNFEELKEEKKVIEKPIEKKEDKLDFSLFVRNFYSQVLPTKIEISDKTVKKEIIVQVLNLFVKGEPIRAIDEKIKTIHQLNVREIVKLFKEGNANNLKLKESLTINDCYQKYAEQKFKLEKVDDHLYNNNNYVVPIAFLFDDKRKNEIDKSKTDLKAFNDLIGNSNHTGLLLIYRNAKWDDNDYIYQVLLNNLTKTIKLERNEKFIGSLPDS